MSSQNSGYLGDDVFPASQSENESSQDYLYDYIDEIMGQVPGSSLSSQPPITTNQPPPTIWQQPSSSSSSALPSLSPADVLRGVAPPSPLLGEGMGDVDEGVEGLLWELVGERNSLLPMREWTWKGRRTLGVLSNNYPFIRMQVLIGEGKGGGGGVWVSLEHSTHRGDKAKSGDVMDWRFATMRSDRGDKPVGALVVKGGEVKGSVAYQIARKMRVEEEGELSPFVQTPFVVGFDDNEKGMWTRRNCAVWLTGLMRAYVAYKKEDVEEFNREATEKFNIWKGKWKGGGGGGPKKGGGGGSKKQKTTDICLRCGGKR